MNKFFFGSSSHNQLSALQMFDAPVLGLVRGTLDSSSLKINSVMLT